MRLITMTVIKDREKDLVKWLNHTYQFADKMIILENNSKDRTLEILKDYNDVENKIILIPEVDIDFSTEESKIRAMLWNATRKVAKEGDWIMTLDSDEILEQSFVSNKDKILKFLVEEKYEIMWFKFCDMWSETEYRTDKLWSPFFPRLYKFVNEEWGPTATGLHNSNIPLYATKMQRAYISNYRVKHFSYHTEEIRMNKYNYYTQRTQGINLQHAKSILDPNPQLKKFIEPKHRPKVMFCSLIRDRAWILPAYLEGVKNLNYPKKKMWYYFIVNNTSDDSAEIIAKWAEENDLKDRVKIEILNFENAHRSKERDWNEQIISNMAYMRTRHLTMLRELECDYLFSVDSDILLHPDVLNHAILQDKDIISPVFWARWDSEGGRQLPQVWIRGGYETSEDFIRILQTMKLRVQVGGLGACTLISRKVAETPNMTYERVYNLPTAVRGEDRDFCIRAVCLGFDLWATTFIPLRHVDRKEELQDNLKYIKENNWWNPEHWFEDER